MSYQNIAYHNGTIHLWDEDKGYKKFRHNRYAYKKSSNGKYTALDGTRVERITSWDREDEGLYESDINPETRTLIDLYYENDDPSSKHRELFFDIECSTKGGFASAEDPWQPLTAIALRDRARNRRIALIIDTTGKIPTWNIDNATVEVVADERELIIRFLQLWVDINPTIITGWNIDSFDIPYLYNRIKLVLGIDYANSLSPIEEVVYNDRTRKYKILGVSSLDYMLLYKKFAFNEEASYALDYICKKELGRGKIEYTGTLDHLLANDFKKYVEYNLNDVDLVYDLDEKLQYLSLVRSMAHKGHVPYEDIYETSKIIDGACLTYLKRLNIIALNKIAHVKAKNDDDEDDDDEDHFEGALVKEPQRGLHEWVFDIDMKALYPSEIITLNISPETKLYRVQNWDAVKDDFWNSDYSAEKVKISSSKTIPVMEFRKWLEDNKYSISAIGVIYDLKKKGLVPSILELWAQERTEYRVLAKKYGTTGNADMAKFFDIRQQAVKRLSNSFYGFLGLRGSRFYDLDNAESITMSAQATITHAMKIANEWMFKKLGVRKDYIVASDTDSCFLSASFIIKLMEEKSGKEFTDSEKTDITFKTAVAVEKYINKTWDEFAKNIFNADKHEFEIKQEYVARTAFWTAKKRYAQKILSEKGILIKDLTNGKEDWKLDIKGIDVVRSNYPKAFREFMSGLLVDILNVTPKKLIDTKVVNIKEDMKKMPVLDVMFPTGIKNLKKYTTKKAKGDKFRKHISGATAHAKAAINYNDLIDYYELQDTTQPIIDGSKIKWVYLRSNPFNLETCAVKGYDDPEEIVKFIAKYIDYNKVYDSALANKLLSFYIALGWGTIPKNDISEFFDFS